MTDKPHYRKTKLQSEEASEEIRPDELLKATAIEAKTGSGPDSEPLKNIPVTNSNYWRFKGEQRTALPKGIKWGVAGLVVLFIGGSILSYYVVRRNIATQISARIQTLQAGVNDLQNLDPQSAQQEFASLNSENTSASGVLDILSSLFAGSSGAIKSFTDLSSQLTTLSGDLSQTQNDIFSFIAPSEQESSTFVGDLDSIRATLAAINIDTNQLSSAASYFGGATSPLSGSEFISLKTQMQSAQNFLDAFVPWLSDTSSTHHILVLLQNPSEMRPGGGFIGSYADVSIEGGAIIGVDVHDVADVDKTFTQKTVPPVPLQLEETAFRPADGNWFFDFPTSASETLNLFNESGLYANTSTTFDGVVAITPQVMSDLLSITGPITVSTTQFTSDNLAVQIQKIVQAGQAKSSAGPSSQATYPKGILQALWQSMFQQIASATSTQKTQILNLAFNWVINRDVMTYFTDPAFQTFASTYNAAGSVYQLPQNLNSDYLAVVNADINSDKSELYVSQNINYDAVINADGTLSDHVDITRTHNGNESPYWWYQTTNQDYIQMFVPSGASLTNESGGITKNVPAPINYAKQGYLTDPLVFTIQSSTQEDFSFPKVTTHQESGKEVFGVWDRTYAGSSTDISFDYTQHLSALPADGVPYQFVFERQSGSQQNDTFEIDAPLGYVFAENQLATFIYKSGTSTTPGSMVVNLTLQKLQ